MKRIFYERIRGLFDGLDKNEDDWNLAKRFLIEFQTANDMSLKELDSLCWEDSNWIFDQIYGF